jgi:hypothetical protein
MNPATVTIGMKGLIGNEILPFDIIFFNPSTFSSLLKFYSINYYLLEFKKYATKGRNFSSTISYPSA